ncbi:hypothetical protein ACR2S0_004440 [Vibrio vulnificus]
MENFKVIKNQIIAGTGLYNHGESYSKEFFEELLELTPNRMPLHTQHVMGAKTSGFLENFRLVPHGDEWVVIADVYIEKGSVNPDLKGFSFSATKKMAGNLERPVYNIYLPYPYYNDQAFIDELLSNEPDLMVGKWIKKGLTGLEIGLIASAICLIVAPEWDIQYKNHVRPALVKVISYIPKLKSKGIPVDLVQQIDFKGSTIKLYFIPDKTSETLEKESTSIDCFESGYRNAINFISNDAKCSTVGARMVKVYYDSSDKEYKVFHIQYNDGTDEHIA